MESDTSTKQAVLQASVVQLEQQLSEARTANTRLFTVSYGLAPRVYVHVYVYAYVYVYVHVHVYVYVHVYVFVYAHACIACA